MKDVRLNREKNERLSREMELYGFHSPNIVSMENRKGGLIVFITQKEPNLKEEIIFTKEGKLIKCPPLEKQFFFNN